ncbi:MAG: toll/interleukin-1 receptor domain-containing protein [Mycobacterium sp.]|uniref:toll/interleukin-1 receptor domain-containing protein n=1 Tax=Mycobacterium sp. TaxID=1785 RepID=UPI003C58A45D
MAVFISYSSRDRQAVESIVRALQRARESVWLDREIGPGEQWWREILGQIRDCEVFITALSENWEQSRAYRSELEYAQALRLPIIPVQIGPLKSMVVNRVGHLQIIDYRVPTSDTGITLTTEVRLKRERRRPLASPLPPEPPVHFQYLMRFNSQLDQSLGPRDQETILNELRRDLYVDGRDEVARKGITLLLGRLREHHDVTALIQQQVDALLGSAVTQPISRFEMTQRESIGPAPEKTEPAPTPSRRSRWQPNQRATWAGAALIVAVIVCVLAYVLWPAGTQVIPPPGTETSASCHMPDAGTGPYSHWSIGANTSCGFGLNVATSVNHLNQQTGNLTGRFELADVQSAATGRKYPMACVLDRKLVTCTGGNPTATVYIW